MRKLLPFLAFAAAVAVATPAFAYPDERYPVEPYVAPIAGAAVGTAVGVGLYNGWYTGAFAASLPATAVGAAAIGGVAGIGTVALVEAYRTLPRLRRYLDATGPVRRWRLGRQSADRPSPPRDALIEAPVKS